MRYFNTIKGFATIPTILALSMLILIVATGIAATTFTENATVAIDKQSQEAKRNAEAGAKDALMRIARDKNYICVATDCYSLDLIAGGCTSNEGCAKISVSAGIGTAGDPKIIIAKGIKQNKTRKLEVRVVYDASGNGEIASTAWRELSD